MPPNLPSRHVLYELFRKGHRLTQAQAAERLGVSKRQVRRVLDGLDDEDVPLREAWEDGEKVYALPESKQASEGPFSALTEREALALLVAAEAARPTLRPTPLAEPLEAVGRRLAERMAPHVTSFEPEVQPRRWHFDAAAASTFDPAVFEVLQDAIEAKQSVRMNYVTASTGERHEGRQIDPLLLAAAGSSWLVVAYCHKREDVLDFALAGIDRIEKTDNIFEPPQDFDPMLHFKGRFSALTGEKSHVVRLIAEPEAARYFQRKKYHPTQQITEREDEDRVEVSFEVDGLEEVRSFVQSWGTGVTVLAPDELVQMVAEDARRVAKRYNEHGGKQP